MGSQSEGTGSYWSIYLRLQTTETPVLMASSGGVGGGLNTIRSMAKFSSLTRWNTVRRSSFLYLAMTLTQPYVEMHNAVYSVRTALLVGRSRDRFPVASLGIFSVATDRKMCPGVDSASKNEYQGFILG